MKPHTKQFLIPTSIGIGLAILYWVLLSTSGFDAIERTLPHLARTMEVATIPTVPLLALVHALHLPPYGDAGFVWFIILPGLQWIILGPLAGAAWVAIGRIRNQEKAEQHD